MNHKATKSKTNTIFIYICKANNITGWFFSASLNEKYTFQFCADLLSVNNYYYIQLFWVGLQVEFVDEKIWGVNL